MLLMVEWARRLDVDVLNFAFAVSGFSIAEPKARQVV